MSQQSANRYDNTIVNFQYRNTHVVRSCSERSLFCKPFHEQRMYLRVIKSYIQ